MEYNTTFSRSELEALKYLIETSSFLAKRYKKEDNKGDDLSDIFVSAFLTNWDGFDTKHMLGAWEQLKNKIDNLLEFYRFQDNLLAKAVSNQIKKIFDKKLSFEETRKLIQDCLTSLKPETHSAYFRSSFFDKDLAPWLEENKEQLESYNISRNESARI